MSKIFNLLEPDTSENAKCHFCHKELHGGRTDRRFCNDNCRSAFNRLKKKEEIIGLGETEIDQVIKILKRNYALLREFNKSDEQGKIIDRELIYKKGFNFMYYTSCKVIDHEMYYFCFERGWRDLDYALIELSINYDQIRH